MAQANVAIDELRAEYDPSGQPSLSYEVLALDPASLTKLEHQALERLVYFLDCRGTSLENPQGLFVSLFTHDTLYFIAAREFIALTAKARGLSLDELKRRYGSNGTGAPLMLGTQ